MARIERQTKRHPSDLTDSDLTDKEWERIAPLLPGACGVPPFRAGPTFGRC